MATIAYGALYLLALFAAVALVVLAIDRLAQFILYGI
jgi:hypothetical protein